MTYCFDLDGTLCTNTDGKYEQAQPFINRINVVNRLYNEGHKILIDSARGSTSGIDWLNLTTQQLYHWGVLYHAVRVGLKTEADIFVDDKAINHNDFFK